MEETQIFKRSKERVATAETALEQICYTQKLEPSQLVAEHSDTHWQYRKISASSIENQNEFRIRRDASSEKEAVQAAMSYFDTFEGNLRDESTEEEFVYSRVR